MVNILGVNFPERRIVKKALQSFFGIGPDTSARLLARYHIHPTARVGELGDDKVLELASALSNMTIENNLRRQILDDIKRLRDIGTYRGRRHAMNLPVRGQNTRSQIKTATKLNRVERKL
ncbi:putative 40s ribosomal protein s13 [Phaeomoniella chlamydospora]|uniref:Putative 40s ribosomal protein s13 n=1 Tax=Phaeomoniella chlamydospora TaxID=158046 RepID=A0A0G2HL50_PHACM|nr:putative 40s ribosomal protein s13 [Phaeomoniella chlamydospora]